MPKDAGPVASRKPHGRPPRLSAEAREAAILDAMERSIAERGLEGASMSAIARAAGMSKRTLYVAFESRDALFAAWVRRLRASHVRPLQPSEQDLPLAERLRRLLRREAKGVASEARLRVLRALVVEAPKRPEVARTFLREGPEAARAIVADELRRAVERGEARIEDVDAAARVLCDMAYACPLDRLMTAEPAPAMAEAAESRLDLAVAIFVGGVGRPGA